MTTRTQTSWTDLVDALPGLGLEEVDARAALQTRVDRKYVVDPRTWGEVLATLDRPGVLEIDGRRSFGYSSTYYDTEELDSYRDAARRRPRRYKVRTRRYLDTGSAAIEVKLRASSGATAKSRQWLPEAPADAPLPAEAVAFVGGFDRIGVRADRLGAVLTTAYQRVTLVTADARITVDRDVTAVDSDGRRLDYGDLLIVETKSAGRPGAVDRALWARGIRPTRLSKYATSLAVLRPDLPAHPWTRSIRRHLPAAAGSGAAA
jgi:hypothetical protein